MIKYFDSFVLFIDIGNFQFFFFSFVSMNNDETFIFDQKARKCYYGFSKVVATGIKAK